MSTDNHGIIGTRILLVLAVLIGTSVLACSTVTPVPAEATPNIDATVEAKAAQERAVDATVAVSYTHLTLPTKA